MSGHAHPTNLLSLQGMDLVVYGDSIVEGFRGLGMGSFRPKMRTNNQAWTELIQPNFRAVPWGISGKAAAAVEGLGILDMRLGHLQTWAGSCANPWSTHVLPHPTLAAGDRAMNLLWRIRNGEGPEGMKTKVIVVLIGTNDIGRMQYLFEASAAVPACT